MPRSRHGRQLKLAVTNDFLAIDALLTDDQRLARDSAREFVVKEIEPHLVDCHRQESFLPSAVIKKFGTLGLLGSNLDGYGLPAIDNISYGLIMRELERADSGVRSFASVQGSLVMYPIHAYGSEQQKQHWLPKLKTAEAIGCFALTEQQGGSDPANMQTHVVDCDDHYLLNGTKMWITNGNIADIAVVWARLDEQVRGFIVPCKTAGVTVNRLLGKLSLRISVTSELHFADVRLSKDSILPQTNGLNSALSCLTQARYGIAWGAIGAAEACFDEVLAFSKERRLFGAPLASKQLVQSKLATMLTEISKARLLALRLGQLKDAGLLHYPQVSMGKQSNVAMALQVARTSRDILGANGIMDEYQTMRHMCNLETVSTYEGTNDVHLLVLGRELTGIAAY